MSDTVRWLHEFDDAPARIGGKARGLVRLIQAGFPVPEGFVVWPEASDAEVEAAYAKLGGAVAVRSSAVEEDGDIWSFAGMQTTVLNVIGIDAVKAALQTCRIDTNSEKAREYWYGVDLPPPPEPMCVIIQRMVPGTIGVLFTQSLDNPERMTAETFVPECHSWKRGSPPAEPAWATTLDDLGQRIETHFGQPQDIEWAYHDGTVWILQSRPVTTPNAQEIEGIRQQEIAWISGHRDRGVWAADSLAAELPMPTPLVWDLWKQLLNFEGGLGRLSRDLGGSPESFGSPYSLVAGRVRADLLTLTGMMFRNSPLVYPIEKYREAMPTPDAIQPVLDPSKLGFWGWLSLPRTAWRLYWLTKSTQQQMATFAERYRNIVAPKFRREADAALAEDWSQHSGKTLFELLQTWAEKTFRDFARDSLKPAVFAQQAQAKLMGLLKEHVGDDMAMTLAELTSGLTVPPEADLTGAMRQLADGRMTREQFLLLFGHRGPNEYDLMQPRWRDDPNRLPKPQISATDDFSDLAARLKTINEKSLNDRFQPIAERYKIPEAKHRAIRIAIESCRGWLALREVAKNDLARGLAVMHKAIKLLGAKMRLHGEIRWMRLDEIEGYLRDQTGDFVVKKLADSPTTSTPLPLRERGGGEGSALHGESVFSHEASAPHPSLETPKAGFPNPPSPARGEGFKPAGEPRGKSTVSVHSPFRQWQAFRTMYVPTVLFLETYDQLGLPPQMPEGTVIRGTAVSPGFAEGLAFVPKSTSDIPPSPGFILVVEHPDTAWLPLMTRAAGMLFAVGGVLSHGAIVARELGLPAVGQIPDATTMFKTGERLILNGSTGQVSRSEAIK
ncbi:MAG: PEP/pyruvate-binding domain-containing protein [Fimbriiglobus sp.]